MSVIFTEEVVEYFNELTGILYEKEYFGFRESALKYVGDLVDEIIAELPFKAKKPAPPRYDRYGKGMWYASFRKNKNTQWYVFFTVYRKDGELVYLVRYIGNNHTEAKFLQSL